MANLITGIIRFFWPWNYSPLIEQLIGRSAVINFLGNFHINEGLDGKTKKRILKTGTAITMMTMMTRSPLTLNNGHFDLVVRGYLSNAESPFAQKPAFRWLPLFYRHSPNRLKTVFTVDSLIFRSRSDLLIYFSLHLFISWFIEPLIVLDFFFPFSPSSATFLFPFHTFPQSLFQRVSSLLFSKLFWVGSEFFTP